MRTTFIGLMVLAIAICVVTGPVQQSEAQGVTILPPPTVTVSPFEGAAGSTVTVTAKSFCPDYPILIFVNSQYYEDGQTRIGVFQTDSIGSFTIRLTVPSDAPLGTFFYYGADQPNEPISCGRDSFIHGTFTVTSVPSTVPSPSPSPSSVPSPSPNPRPSPSPSPSPTAPNYGCQGGASHGDECDGSPKGPINTSCPTFDLPGANRNIVLVIHGWNGLGKYDDRDEQHLDLEDGLTPRIDAALGRDWDVEFLDWRDYAGGHLLTGLVIDATRAAEAATRIGASCLAKELIRLDYTSNIHFIAHSAGVWMAGAAAAVLEEEGSESHVQLTALDAYVPPVLFGDDETLFKNEDYKIGYGVDLFDNYYHDDGLLVPYTQHNFTNACDIDVSEGEVIDLGPDGGHSQPIGWYAATIQNADGWGWPLAPESGRVSGKSCLGTTTDSIDGDPPMLSTTSIEPKAAVDTCAANPRSSQTGEVSLPGCDSARLRTASPAWLILDVTTEPGTNFLELTLDFESPQPAYGWFQVVLDETVISVTDERSSPQEPFTVSIDLGWQLPAGTHQLALRLDNLTAADSIIEVSDIRFGVASEVITPRTAPLPPNTGDGAAPAPSRTPALLVSGIALALAAASAGTLLRRRR